MLQIMWSVSIPYFQSLTTLLSIVMSKLANLQIYNKVVEGEVQSKIGRYPKIPEQQSVQRIFGRFFGHLLKMLPAGLGDGQRQIR